MKNKLLMSVISCVLAVALFVQMAPAAFAASTVKYISEIRISYGSSTQGAKDALTAQGFTVLDTDLNEGTGKGYSFLGYKTTDKAEEAITDIKLLNMNSGFTTSSTSDAIQKMYADFKKDAEYMMKVVEKFRGEYAAGSPYAKAACQSLNVFTYSTQESVPEEKLGDYLLNKANIDDLIQLMFFVHRGVTLAFYNTMAMGIISKDAQSWMKTAAENIQNKNRQYTEEEENRADELEPYILAFGDFYRKNIERLENDNSITAEDLSNSDAISLILFASFRNYKFNNTDLASYLINPDISWDEILPIAAAISDEQRTLIEILGIIGFEPQGFFETGALDKYMESLKGDVTISVWEGIDRMLMKEPAGITLNAGMESNLGGAEDSLNVALSGGAFEVLASGVTGGLLTLTITEAASGSIMSTAGKAVGAAKTSLRNLESVSGGVRKAMSRMFESRWLDTTKFMDEASAFMDVHTKLVGNQVRNVEAAQARMAQTLKTVNKISRVGRYVGFGVILVTAVISAAMMAKNLHDYYNPEYTDIPYNLFDVKMNEKDEATYIKYHAALKPDGKKGDLNGFEGKTWTAVYTTKDPAMGDPITTDFLTKSTEWNGTAPRPEGYVMVSLFGYTTPGNLNTGVFSSTKSIFLFFKREAPAAASTTGSIFAAPTAAVVFGGIGLITGGLLVFVGMTLINRKKKKVTVYADEATSE